MPAVRSRLWSPVRLPKASRGLGDTNLACQVKLCVHTRQLAVWVDNTLARLPGYPWPNGRNDPISVARGHFGQFQSEGQK